MGLLKSILWNYLPRNIVEKEFCLLIIGLEGAGKTTMLENLKLGNIQLLTPVKGFTIETVKYGNITFISWDVGRKQYLNRYLWKFYYTNIQLIVFVVDSSDIETIADAKDELDFIMSEEELDDVPILVMTNKSDKQSAMSTHKLAALLLLNERRDRLWLMRSCTAKDGDVLYDAINSIFNNIDGEETG